MSDQISVKTIEVDHSKNFELMLKAFDAYLSSLSDSDLEKELGLADRSVLLLNLATLSADGINSHKPLAIYRVAQILSQRLTTYFNRMPKSSATEIRVAARRQSITARFTNGANSHISVTVWRRVGRPDYYVLNESTSSLIVDPLTYLIMQYASSAEDQKRELEIITERNKVTGPRATPTPYQQRIGRLEV